MFQLPTETALFIPSTGSQLPWPGASTPPRARHLATAFCTAPRASVAHKHRSTARGPTPNARDPFLPWHTSLSLLSDARTHKQSFAAPPNPPRAQHHSAIRSAHSLPTLPALSTTRFHLESSLNRPPLPCFRAAPTALGPARGQPRAVLLRSGSRHR